MVSNSEVLTEGVWFQVANDVDYVMQNKGKQNVLVKAAAVEPTSVDGAISLKDGEAIASSLLSGVIWATASRGQSTIAYAV